MMKSSIVVCVLVGMFAAAACSAQPKLQREKLKRPDLPAVAELFWTHPQGDCTHLIQQHPNGDAGKTFACAHPPVPAHAGGHPGKAPCPHRVPQHVGGDDTGKKAPCIHLRFGKPQHPEGHSIFIPCAHPVAEHPDGHAVTTPCTHLVAPHREGHTGPAAPCTHLTAEHPKGHPGVPCAHPMRPTRVDSETRLVFFTDDAQIQRDAILTVKRLKALGIDVCKPQPLNVFYREPINGDPEDNKDPFWSHYEPVKHAIQLVRGRPLDKTIETLHHEIGHALLGHSCVQITTKGGPHTLKDASDPALAMSEGWAHFVALVVEKDRSSASFQHKSLDWENAHAHTDIVLDSKNEFRVAAVLWDLFDTRRDPKSPDSISLEFSEMFKVYRPSMETIRKGPLIPSLENYLERLKLNNSFWLNVIEAVRAWNLAKQS